MQYKRPANTGLTDARNLTISMAADIIDKVIEMNINSQIKIKLRKLPTENHRDLSDLNG